MDQTCYKQTLEYEHITKLIPILDCQLTPVVFLGELTCFTHEVLKVEQNPINSFRSVNTLAIYLNVLFKCFTVCKIRMADGGQDKGQIILQCHDCVKFSEF